MVYTNLPTYLILINHKICSKMLIRHTFGGNKNQTVFYLVETDTFFFCQNNQPLTEEHWNKHDDVRPAYLHD